MERAGLVVTDLFRSGEELVNELVKRESQQQLSLVGRSLKPTVL